MNHFYRYKNQLIELYSLFEFGRNLLGQIEVTDSAAWYQEAAILAYQQAVGTTGIVLSYLPYSPIQSPIETFSPLTLGSQIRVLVDIYLTIAYLLEEKNQEMSELQEMVWEQAVDWTRHEMVRGINPENKQLSTLRERIKNRKADIESHNLYGGLDPSTQNNCSNGYSDKIYKNNELVDRFDLDSDTFWSMYSHYSQFIHSTAFASDQLAAFQIDRDGATHFTYTMAANLSGIFSMNTLAISEGLGVESEEIPLSVLNILLYWKDFFQGNYENPGPRPTST